jgi:hypothetical protein
MTDPPGRLTRLDVARLDASLREALTLLRRTYSPSPETGGGGWYHQLETPTPGATATAVGLMIFHECQMGYEHMPDALAFLRVRQVSSDDSQQDGGWATNTSFGRPVVEATGWVAQMIGAVRVEFAPGGPDAQRALAWLAENQNEDGGWGSFKGCPSRVWLTCIALRGLIQLNPYHKAIDRGLDWLLNGAAQPAGWGEVPRSQPTVTHTGLALITFAEARPALADDRLLRAHDWLADHVDVTALDDRDARLETYSVAYAGSPGSAMTAGRLALWHYGLPVAICALLRDPRGIRLDLVLPAAETVLAAQLPGGQWPSFSGSSSLWGVWWCSKALLDLERLPLVRPGDVVLGTGEALAVLRAGARDRSVAELLGRPQRFDIRGFVARHWATFLLALSMLLALVGVITNALSWQEFAVGMIFPLALFVVQEYRGRRRG